MKAAVITLALTLVSSGLLVACEGDGDGGEGEGEEGEGEEGEGEEGEGEEGEGEEGEGEGDEGEGEEGEGEEGEGEGGEFVVEPIIVINTVSSFHLDPNGSSILIVTDSNLDPVLDVGSQGGGLEDAYVIDLDTGDAEFVSGTLNDQSPGADDEDVANAVIGRDGNGDRVIAFDMIRDPRGQSGFVGGEVYRVTNAGAELMSSSDVTIQASGGSGPLAMSADGAVLAFDHVDGFFFFVAVGITAEDPHNVVDTAASTFPSRLSMSADGSRIAFGIQASLDPVADDDEGFFDVYVVEIDPASGTLLEGPTLVSVGPGTGSSDPTLSPDGTELFFVTADTLDVADTHDGLDYYRCTDILEPTQACTVFVPGGTVEALQFSVPVEYSPNGRFVAFTGGFNLELYRLDLDTDDIVLATPTATINGQELDGNLGGGFVVDDVGRLTFVVSGASSGWFPGTSTIARVTP